MDAINSHAANVNYLLTLFIVKNAKPQMRRVFLLINYRV